MNFMAEALDILDVFFLYFVLCCEEIDAKKLHGTPKWRFGSDDFPF